MKLLLPGQAILVPILFLGGCDAQAPPAGQPRNVILISIDTLRPDHLGCYGHDRETSPAIDRVAAGGVLFEDATSSSPWTVPAHATLLTGTYPSTHGLKDHGFTLPDDIETLATRLGREGYRTWALVNSFNVGSPSLGLARGVEPGRFVYLPEADLESGGLTLNSGPQITETALEWMRSRDDRPFFLFLHYYDVHTDFTPAPEYVERFVSSYDGPLTGETGQLVQFRREKRPLSEADVRFLKEMYDAEIRQLDDVLDGLLDFLDESGLSRETLVAITSDHGEEFYEHQSLLHGRSHYQELLAVPLILRGPGLPQGMRVGEPVHLVDVAPTILSLLGLATGEEIDGIDLSAFWRDPAALPDQRFLFGEADHNNQVNGRDVIDIKKMVRLGSDKLHFDRATGAVELYDLEQDPGEQRNLSGVRRKRQNRLLAELERFVASARAGVAVAPPDEEAVRLLMSLGYVGDEE